jgi:chromosome segregation protein
LKIAEGRFMHNKKQLFRKITLKNFMLHEQTTVNFAAEAITLVTGANGSGKTQILDGLIICLGYIPSRARAKGLGSLVGSNGPYAEIILEVGNPLIDGVRAIHTLDKELNKIIAFDSFRITAKVSQEESSVTYAINNSRRIIRGRTVTRRDIRRIFDAINVRGNNQLAFTGEGTVDEFASKSARRKLDVLLEVTGLKQYREEVVEAQQILKASIQEIGPLKRKYETERKLLNLWQEAMDILKQKKKLVVLRRKLEIEQSWAHVVRMEDQLESINQERSEIVRQRTENERAMREKKQELTIAEKKLDQLRDRLTEQEEEELNKNRKIITLEAQIRNEQDNITSFNKEIERYQQQITKLEKVLKTKNLSTKDKHIRDKQEILVIKNKKLSLIQDKLQQVEEE